MNVKYFFSIIACIAFSVFPVHSQGPTATDNLKVLGASLSSVVTDKFQYDLLGTKDVSPEIQAKVKELSTALKLKETPTTKEMSPLLRSCIGSKNCMATHNALFVDGSWLKNLEQNKRNFVLAHELTHIKNKDTLQTIFSLVGFFGVIGSSINFFKDYSFGIVGMGATAFAAVAAFATKRRSMETQADVGAATVVPEAVNHNHHHTHTALQQPWYKKTWKWFSSWFAEYPENRIAV